MAKSNSFDLRSALSALTAGLVMSFGSSVQAATGTIPPGMHSFIGAGAENGNSIFVIIQSVAFDVVMVIEVVVGAIVLGFFYLGVVNFVRGSRMADKRMEGKTQLFYALIAAALLGAGGMILSALYAWGQSMHG